VFVVKGEAAIMEKQTSSAGCCVPKIKEIASDEQGGASAKATGGCCG
jgi:hypothetical protein